LPHPTTHVKHKIVGGVFLGIVVMTGLEASVWEPALPGFLDEKKFELPVRHDRRRDGKVHRGGRPGLRAGNVETDSMPRPYG